MSIPGVLSAPWWRTQHFLNTLSYFLSGNANRKPRPIITLPVNHFIRSAIRGVADSRSPIAPEKSPYALYTNPHITVNSVPITNSCTITFPASGTTNWGK